MKFTKFIHACLLVEMPEPVNRTALFDPGVMSEEALNVDSLKFLDDIFITHEHVDHVSTKIIEKIIEKFPEVRITAPEAVVKRFSEIGAEASSQMPEGVVLLDAPHEKVEPIFPQPEEFGYHYLDIFTHPGDSHSFDETKSILALPVTAPWGAMITAVNLALQLKPKHIIPIHDWHWSDAAREGSYNQLEELFSQHDIVFHKMKTGEPVMIQT